MRPRVQDGYSDTVTLGHIPPHSSHGFCNPIDEYPTALRGPCGCGDKAGVSTATGSHGPRVCVCVCEYVMVNDWGIVRFCGVTCSVFFHAVCMWWRS